MGIKSKDIGGRAKNIFVLFWSTKCLSWPCIYPVYHNLSANIYLQVALHVTFRCHLATFADPSVGYVQLHLVPSTDIYSRARSDNVRH